MKHCSPQKTRTKEAHQRSGAQNEILTMFASNERIQYPVTLDMEFKPLYRTDDGTFTLLVSQVCHVKYLATDVSFQEAVRSQYLRSQMD